MFKPCLVELGVHKGLELRRSLLGICFFSVQEGLTDLGKLMAFLPVEPRIAKMIIFGAIFR